MGHPLASLDAVYAGVIVAEGVLLAWMALRLRRAKGRLRSATKALGRASTDALRLRREAARAEVTEALRARGREPRLPLEFHAQYGEDLLLWDLFRDQPTGYYVEAGAYDGTWLSSTYALEAIGWTGLLVEPLPERFRECRERRPASRVVNAALGRPGAPAEATLLAVKGEGGIDMLSHLGGSSAHASRIRKEGGVVEPVKVPRRTLEDVLREVGAPPTVDVAVIDVEGHELEVLEGVDWARRAPRVLVVEDNSEGKDATVASFLTGKGYAHAGRIGCNDVFVRGSETELRRRAERWLAS